MRRAIIRASLLAHLLGLVVLVGHCLPDFGVGDGGYAGDSCNDHYDCALHLNCIDTVCTLVEVGLGDPCFVDRQCTAGFCANGWPGHSGYCTNGNENEDCFHNHDCGKNLSCVHANSDSSWGKCLPYMGSNCTPDCGWNNQCGEDGCGGICGYCTGIDSVCYQDRCVSETWVDWTTKLEWRAVPAEHRMTWEAASLYCSGIKSAYADNPWRLPTIGELRTLIDGCFMTETGGSCNVDDGNCLSTSCAAKECQGCPVFGPSPHCASTQQLEGACEWYWSSSTVEDIADHYWTTGFSNGFVAGKLNKDEGYSRCVKKFDIQQI